MNYPKFQFLSSKASPAEKSCYALGIFEKDDTTPDAMHLVDEPFYHDVVVPLIKESGFTGKQGTTTTANCFHSVGKVILVGLGKQETVDQETMRQAAGTVYNACVKLHSPSVVVHFMTLFSQQAHLKAFAEGIFLAAYLDERFKSQKETKAIYLKEVHLLHATADDQTIELAQKITTGANLARALVNAPANHVTPSMLAQTATELAQRHHLELNILEKEDCARLGMGAYLSVTQGSNAPPKFIHLCYKPKSLDTQPPKIALIGKGVTFDSGGLNLKIGNAQIELMKYDMAGAAAVLGAAEAIGAIKPNKEIHFIIAATENMISGSATKPGDVVTASNGKTIEIDNTDAEGRLTLADALVYAEKLGVDAIVDLATLTGAIVVALGTRMAGIFGSDPELINSLMAASPRTGEKTWQMPLESSYFEHMHSIIADMRNTGSKKGAGSITAALFLKQFVEKTAWVHLDIAGTVWTEKPWCYYNAGATGFGVRLLVDWILNS
ncbi:MAG: leucyl aminopeptidase [Candidatus Cardinium sp.]|uniref:leucyl aminopeptidase n=1 Tax=Cardinium endosymbiont of Dermatophagoides farinae TaxID=2597823 RepID=UPI001182668C|nr:leucyl aminopeptidase [Cardinium endosymbiont of Dermatophagoides farinae]TSJ80685.1 leucyl aminopeptidase [Cardinium endosymbiont of Dermatophagoides farinae]UWW96678.1 MAG: leucyl aminopeptidase [Candidatus Cardinium sp.]